jgi:hypothetical protein
MCPDHREKGPKSPLLWRSSEIQNQIASMWSEPAGAIMTSFKQSSGDFRDAFVALGVNARAAAAGPIHVLDAVSGTVAAALYQQITSVSRSMS